MSETSSMKKAFALLLVLGVLLSLSACVQTPETKTKQPAKEAVTTPPPIEAQLSAEDMASIESELSDAEQLLADVGLEEQIDVTPATEL